MPMEMQGMSWRIRGSYFESCNCDAICPCRRINGVPGGRSTHGVCMGVLSWLIEDGAVGRHRPVRAAGRDGVRYSDDEPGSPWTWILYLDERATDEQRAALEAIYSGRARRRCQGPLPVGMEGERARRGAGPSRSTSTTRAGVRGCASATTSASASATATQGDETVSCVIPGHDRTGEELVTDELVVDDERLQF